MRKTMVVRNKIQEISERKAYENTDNMAQIAEVIPCLIIQLGLNSHKINLKIINLSFFFKFRRLIEKALCKWDEFSLSFSCQDTQIYQSIEP